MIIQASVTNRQQRKESPFAWRDLLAASWARVCLVYSRDQLIRSAEGPVTIHLARDEVVSLARDCRQRRINVRRGIIWLTDTPAQNDVLLRPDDCFQFTGRGPFVLQALEEAEIVLHR